jgi:uncharacterized protein (DUF4415 family)
MPTIRKTIRSLKDIPSIPEKRLAKLLAMKDSDIDFSDIPEIDEEFLKHATIVKPSQKQSTTLRIDKPVLNFYKQKGKGYQTFINDVLKEYAKHHGMK